MAERHATGMGNRSSCDAPSPCLHRTSPVLGDRREAGAAALTERSVAPAGSARGRALTWQALAAALRAAASVSRGAVVQPGVARSASRTRTRARTSPELLPAQPAGTGPDGVASLPC
jgi:hypothetical protein